MNALLHNLAAGVRLALFLPVKPTDFRIGVEHYGLLAAFNLLVWILGSYLRTGAGAHFVPGALPDLLSYIPLSLAFCLVAVRLLGKVSLFAGLAVLLASTDLLFEVVGTAIFLGLAGGWDHGWFALSDLQQMAVYVAYVLWAIAVVLRALFLLAPRHTPGLGAAATTLVAMVLLLVYVPREEPWNTPPSANEQARINPLQEDLFHLQGKLLDETLDRLSVQRPGKADLYFLGAAPYAGQDTFVRELAVVRQLVEEDYGAAGRSVALMNHPSTLAAVPIASRFNLRRALERLGETMDSDEDVLMLFITTHGTSDHQLRFEFPPLDLRHVNPTALSRMLADSGIKWKIIVLSACYSGGFIEALRDDNTLIITAADATHSSFGCEPESDFTWFSRAFFDEALREQARQGGFSFTAAFERARETIAERERAAGFEPSNPQLYLGDAMAEKLKALQAQWAKARPATPRTTAAVASSGDGP